jgi:hypothetical protein
VRRITVISSMTNLKFSFLLILVSCVVLDLTTCTHIIFECLKIVGACFVIALYIVIVYLYIRIVQHIPAVVHDMWWQGGWFLMKYLYRPLQYPAMQGVWTDTLPNTTDEIRRQLQLFQQMQAGVLPVQVDRFLAELPDMHDLVGELGPGFVDDFADLLVAHADPGFEPPLGIARQTRAAAAQRLCRAQELGHVATPRQQARCEELQKLADQVQQYEETDPVPQNLCCPITFTPFTQPVVVPSGKTYNRKDLKLWVDEHGTCPLTTKDISGQPWHENLDRASDFEDWATDLLKRKRKDNVSNARHKSRKLEGDQD